jgi:putative serine/threonine protein kinase
MEDYTANFQQRSNKLMKLTLICDEENIVKEWNIVPLYKLQELPYANVLCYPRFELKESEKRICELERLGVTAIEFTGGKNVSTVRVLGKGCVGIVVLAHTETGKAALKIRRTDADRKGMQHEAEMLKKANMLGVGPRLLRFTQNFLLMDFIEGKLLPEWLVSLKSENNPIKTRVSSVLYELLGQCWRMDKAGLDHGELSHAPKHIIVDAQDIPHILDFETASINRKPSNLTSLCQYLFISSSIAKENIETLGRINRNILIKALRVYKQSFSKENFEKILDICGLRREA